MSTKSSPRLFLLTVVLTALTAISVNAGWGRSGSGQSATASSTSARETFTTPLNAITTFDAALIERYPGLSTFNANQQIVADVTGNGGINYWDAANVAMYVVNNGGATGTTGTIVSPGLLMGDVSGAGPHFDGQPGTVVVSLPTTVNTGGTIIIPVTVSDLTGLGVISFDLQVSFDPTVLQPATTPADQAGTLGSYNWPVIANTNNPGHLIISRYTSTPITGSGALANLVFNVVGQPGQSTALTFEDYTDPSGRIHQGFLLNEGTPSAATTNGIFTAAAFTPTPTFTPTGTYTATNTATSTPTSTVTATGTPAMPTLGNYPNSTVTLSANTTIVPDASPTNAVSMSAETTTGFVGELTADPLTGTVRVTNARHANIGSGNYTVTVTAFGVNGVMTTRTFTLTVTNGIPCSQDVLFVPPAVPQVSLPIWPSAVTIGDFNNDGNQDVIASNYNSTNASIRLGDGNGGFTSPAMPQFQLGSRPAAIAIGDFNGDGNQDIATANYYPNQYPNNISIRLGNGSGGFTLPVIPELVAGSDTFKILVGDINGDGKDDLVVMRLGNEISIRYGSGDGGFSSSSIPALSIPGSLQDVEIGDFNNDGFQDLAVGNSVSSPVNYVSIRLGDGSGGFSSPTAPDVPVGKWPNALVIGDFNADGNQDFAAANNGSDSVSVRLGNGSGGFTSPAAAEISVGHSPDSIQIGDFNRDSIQDLAVSYYASNRISIRLGDGIGGFTSPTVPDVVFGDQFFYVKGVGIGDFNGDGIQDLVGPTSGSFSIRLGSCGAPTPTSTITSTNTPTPSNTATPTATPTVDPSAIAVSLPAISAEPGLISVPITVGDLTGREAIAYDLQVTFDPAVLAPASPAFDKTGTLSGAFVLSTNTQYPGHFIVSAVSTAQLAGAGTLLYLRFNVIGNTGQSTTLNFEDYTSPPGPANTFHTAFVFNDGDPSAVTTNGSVTIAPTAISGTVTYGNSIGGQATRFVPNVLLSAAGLPPTSAMTAADGAYSLSGFGTGSYTVTPSKTGGVDGSITAFDAARVAQYVAAIAPLDANQQMVSDVSGSGGVTSFDAAMIAKYVAGPPFGAPGIGSTATWIFNPVTRTYPSLVSNIAGENYGALLMGEVSGNWSGSAGSRPVARANGPVRKALVAAPRVVAETNSEILIPIVVRGAANKNIIAYEFDLRYDPSVMLPETDAVDLAGSVSSGSSVLTNSPEPGLLRVVVYGPLPITQNGVLLNLRFVAVGKPGAMSPLTFERFMFNEGEPGVSVADGQIVLSESQMIQTMSD